MTTKFKVGDRVRHTDDSETIGVVKEALQSKRYNVDFGVYGLHEYPSEYLELAKPAPVYEEGWILNDGKVTIPEGAKLSHCDDGSEVVAFKPLKQPEYRWFNIIKTRDGLNVSGRYNTRYAADMLAHTGRVSRVKIELKEGVWDE